MSPAAADRRLLLAALDGPDRPVLPGRGGDLGAATGLIAAGAALVAVPFAIAALRIGAYSPAALAILIAGAVAGLAVLRWPALALPVFLGLVWSAIGRSFFAGFPSPVELGGLVLVPVAAWLALSRPRYAREVLTIVALLLIPIVVAGLLSPEGAAVGDRRLKDLAFLFAIAMCVRGSGAVERVLVALAVTAIVLGAGAVFSVVVGPTELFGLNEEPTSDQAPRAAGPFGESNFFALSLAALVPALLHLTSRGGWRAPLGAAALIAASAGILAAGSRGGIVAAAFGVVAFALVSRGRARWIATGAIAAAIALVPFFAQQARSSQERTVSGRVTENLIAVAMFADHPVTGVGPQRYPDLFRDYSRRIGDDSRYEREPHSLPLQIAAEQGVVGLLGWAGALLALIRFARLRRLWEDAVARAVLLSIATFGVGSLFLHGSQLRLLYVLVALALACGAAPRGGHREAPA